MQNKRVTIYDIAEIAGVSRQTVSRVLNDSGPVRPETKERILKVMREQDYRPDPLARGLANNRSRVVGVLSPSFTGYINGQILEGAENRANDLGYQTLISRFFKDDNDAEDVVGRLLERQRIEGLLIIHNGSENGRYQLIEGIDRSIPIVTTGYAARHPRVTSVDFDNEAGSILAISHLIETGRRRILNLCGPELDIEVVGRTRGYVRSLREHGVPQDRELTVFCHSWEAREGWKRMRETLEHGTPFDSVFAHSDSLALGALHALREAGYAVPGDVPIIGFDDRPITEFLETPLSTVHRPTFGLGRLAMDILIRKIHKEEIDAKTISEVRERLKINVTPYLVLRASCL